MRIPIRLRSRAVVVVVVVVAAAASSMALIPSSAAAEEEVVVVPDGDDVACGDGGSEEGECAAFVDRDRRGEEEEEEEGRAFGRETTFGENDDDDDEEEGTASTTPPSDPVTPADELAGRLYYLVKDASALEDVDRELKALRTFVESNGGNELVGAVDSEGRNPLYSASFGLLDSGGEGGGTEDYDYDGRDDSGNDGIDRAESARVFAEAIEMLAHDFGADPNGRGPGGRTALHVVARSCDPTAIRSLLDVPGTDPNASDDDGRTPLMVTCASDFRPPELGGPSIVDRTETAEALLDRGADAEAADYRGYGPLHLASEATVPPLIELLLDRGASVAKRTKFGETPLGLVEYAALNDDELSMLFGAGDADDADRKIDDCRALLSKRLEGDDESVSESDRAYVLDEVKAVKFADLLNNALLPVASDPSFEDDPDGQRIELLRALLTYVGLDPNLAGKPFRDVERPTNWYGTLLDRLNDLTPSAYRKVYRTDPTDDEWDLMTALDGTARERAESFDPDTGARSVDVDRLRSDALMPYRERGRTASLMGLFHAMAVQPSQHGVSYGVPSDEALSIVSKHGPKVVEMGAGTGYWTAALRASDPEIDALAYDPNPPGTDENGRSLNVHFMDWTYDDVRRGTCVELFRGEQGKALASNRALVVVWPNNPDAIDNPHLVGPDADDAPAPDAPIWDVDCLESYVDAGGSTVIYVGEREENIDVMEGKDADCGIAASRRFQTTLKENFDLVERADVPRWFQREDDLTVWKKRR